MFTKTNSTIKEWIKQGAKTGDWLGYKRPKQQYQPKDQREIPLALYQYGKNDKNPGLNFTPVPIIKCEYHIV